MFFYCESEQESSCSTPFVSAPSSPTRSKSNSLYYYFSAPSSPPKESSSSSSSSEKNHHQRGFSFTECEFQFHSRFDSQPGAAENPAQIPQEMDDSQVNRGFYFSAPTSPDRNKDRFKKCSYWDEMPGTPKMIFGGGAGENPGENPASFFNADSDFEFSSSRMSDSDSAILSSADELFFKGQILPMKIRSQQLTSSDSSGSSNTMASSSSGAGSAPQSPKSKNGAPSFASLGVSPKRVKALEDLSGSGSRMRALSPRHLLKKYQSMMLLISRPKNGSKGSSCSSASTSSSSSIPRPARSSSKGRTLRELLHLSSVHKKSKPEPPPPPPPQQPEDLPEPPKSEAPEPAPAENPRKSPAESSQPESSNPVKSPRRPVERSLIGDYSKRFNKYQQQQQHQQNHQQQRRFHSLDLHHGGYYPGARRLHSASIVPEAADFPMNLRPDKRLNLHPARMNPKISSTSENRFASAAAISSTLDHHHISRRWESGVYSGGISCSSASSSRNLSPRRARKSGSSLHELHYKSNPRASSEELRRKTFLPYKQGLLGCLGCATMRIAGLSKSLQPMASATVSK